MLSGLELSPTYRLDHVTSQRALKGLPCRGLNGGPQKVCLCPNPWSLEMWPYLEEGPGQTSIRTWKEETVQVGPQRNDECADERRRSRGLSPRAREGRSARCWTRQNGFFPGQPPPHGSSAVGPQTSACTTERMSVSLTPVCGAVTVAPGLLIILQLPPLTLP